MIRVSFDVRKGHLNDAEYSVAARHIKEAIMCKTEDNLPAYLEIKSNHIMSFPAWILDERYVVHPDFNEDCKQLLRGPISDLVHELRWNPNITTRLPSAVKGSEQSFNNKRLKKFNQ